MTLKELRFCAEYVKNGGMIGDAARKAGYSIKTVDKRGHEFLKKPDIVAEIKRLRARKERVIGQRADRSAVEVVNQISKLAFSEILDFMKPDPESPGNYYAKSPEELTPDQRSAVLNFRCQPIYADDSKTAIKRYDYKYTLHDQSAALIQMGRHFGIFDDKLKLVNGSNNRFTNLAPEKLAELRDTIIAYMSKSIGAARPIEGEFSERETPMLSDDRGS